MQLQQIVSAHAARDTTTLREAAHALRGAASNFAAHALVENVASLSHAVQRADWSRGRLIIVEQAYSRLKHALRAESAKLMVKQTSLLSNSSVDGDGRAMGSP